MRKFVASCLTALVLLGTGSSALGLDPSRPPGGNFDLSQWKLTLPDATASEVKQPALASYTSSYFYTAADGAMVFWCPVTGGTTSGTTFPRSELRELLDGRNSSVNWTGDGTHILNAQCRIVQLPSTPKVIIGQVHGYNTQTLVKLQYNDGTIEVNIRNSPTGSDTKYKLFSARVGDVLTYQIKVVDGVATVTVNGTAVTQNFFASDAAWRDVTFYFKAGAYVQDNVGPDTEGGAVAFYQLSLTHGATNPVVVRPTITTQPQSQTLTLGSSVTLTADVAGSSPMTFQWRTNGVMVSGAASSNLTLANFRFPQPLAYNFIVSNYAGAVTSSAAKLYLNSPTRFISNGRDASGRFLTTLVGVTNANYVVEASTNLINWSVIGTNRSSAGLISIIQSNAAATHRFFRARQL